MCSAPQGGGRAPAQHPAPIGAQSPVTVRRVGRIFSTPAPAMDFDFKFNAAEGTAPAPGIALRHRNPDIRPRFAVEDAPPTDTWGVHLPAYYATRWYLDGLIRECQLYLEIRE